MQRLTQSLMVLSVLFFTANASADIATYDIDFSGTTLFGDSLSVSGTLTLDPDLPVGSAIISSSLQLQFASDPVLNLPSVPSYEGPGDVATALDWRVVGNDLFVDRLTNDSAGVVWAITTSPIVSTFQFAAGPNDHAISYINTDTSGIGGITLLPAGGPDAGVGFKVGTAVPEPSSAALAISLLAGAVLRRNRR